MEKEKRKWKKVLINRKRFFTNGVEDNIVKVSTLPKRIYRLKGTTFKVSMIFFVEMERPILNSICNFKRPQKDNRILKRT